MRHPLVDPQPGDRIRTLGEEHVVQPHGSKKTDILLHTIGMAWGFGRWFTLDEWRSWCRRNKAEVVEEGAA
jgi:hypothetical protein